MKAPFKDDDSLFLFCDCKDEGLYIEADLENKDCFYGIDISLWQRGIHPRRMTLWRRIKVALKVLFTGQMHKDQIILNTQSATDVGIFLLNMVQQIKEKHLEDVDSGIYE